MWEVSRRSSHRCLAKRPWKPCLVNRSVSDPGEKERARKLTRRGGLQHRLNYVSLVCNAASRREWLEFLCRPDELSWLSTFPGIPAFRIAFIIACPETEEPTPTDVPWLLPIPPRARSIVMTTDTSGPSGKIIADVHTGNSTGLRSIRYIASGSPIWIWRGARRHRRLRAACVWITQSELVIYGTRAIEDFSDECEFGGRAGSECCNHTRQMLHTSFAQSFT